ncbi:MAG: zinc chelation protein SecC [Acidimicrobiales bacterium]|nr:zinc chelation protein SecC [Acidimicrobiales bacterium]HRW38910.1 YchJ family metal-binding protein [Aquihabitans sp.]
MTDDDPCPCGLPAPYGRCCARFHRGADAPTAELLMRSRYSAFAVGDAAYLERTWHPDTRPRRIHLGRDRSWTGLDVVASTGGGLLDQRGTVEFHAHHRDGAGDDVLHELSEFVRLDGRWVYVAART